VPGGVRLLALSVKLFVKKIVLTVRGGQQDGFIISRRLVAGERCRR